MSYFFILLKNSWVLILSKKIKNSKSYQDITSAAVDELELGMAQDTSQK